MRNKLYPVLDEESEEAFHKTADDDSADKRAHTVSAGKADGERKEREGDAHYDGKARADTPDGIKLHKRTDTGYHHTVLNKGGTDCAVQSHGSRKNHNWRNVADEHRQHVLQTERESFPDGHSTIKLIEIVD